MKKATVKKVAVKKTPTKGVDVSGATRTREDVVHSSGPFQGIASGDVLRVMFKGEQVAMMQVSQVKDFSIRGKDGESNCKITKVSDTDVRFYDSVGSDRVTVLRGITLTKVRVKK